MTEAQIQLQNALTTIFLANLAFLSEYDNDLYHRIDELSRMIGNGTYKEKYSLEFIMDNGDFDIYDLVNEKYLYNKNPKKINDELIRKVEFDEKNSILNLDNYFLKKRELVIENKDKFTYENRKDFAALTQNDMFQYSSVLKDFLEKRKKRLKKIEKFIFLGTLLGRHIPKIAQKIDADFYLVLERNLEIFRLSLFTVDYTILAEKGVIFSIMDESFDEEKKIFKFLSIASLNNYLLKFSSTGINIEKYIDELLTITLSNSASSYDYNRRLYSHANKITKVIQDKYKILHFNKLKENISFFNNLPVLYLAAGPSLNENIEWIKKYQDKFFIVTIGAVYKKLLLHDIKIDMISTLDESETFDKLQFDDESVAELNKNTVILASVITSQKVLKKFNKNNLFLYEVFVPFIENNIAFSGYSVGEITLDLLLKMNAKEIYLLGLDLALNQQTGESHSKDSNSRVSKLNLEEKQNRDTFSLKKSLIKVKGNQEEEVFTTSLFFSSIKSAENKISKKDNDVKIYNLSSHGAYFNNTISTAIDTLNIYKCDRVSYKIENLLETLNENSIRCISQDKKKNLENEIIFLKEEIFDILNKIENKKFDNFEEFLLDILKIPTVIIKNKYNFLYQILHEYYLMLIPYLMYHFNDLKVKNESKKVDKIKLIFLNQMKNITDDYKICLERVVY